MEEYFTDSQEETENAGTEVAGKFAAIGKTFLLYGNLGAGKTAFVRGFIRKLTGDKNLSVTSPTFVLSYTYASKTGDEIRHLDLYRLKSAEEIYELDIENAFENCITLIEWPEIIGDQIPNDAIKITFERISDEKRKITVTHSS